MEKPVKIIDIADMPKFNPIVTNGIHSVSEGKIFWTDNNFVTCREHGACLCVSKNRKIWRCPACNEGAYVEWSYGVGVCLANNKECDGDGNYCRISEQNITAYKNGRCNQWKEVAVNRS